MTWREKADEYIAANYRLVKKQHPRWSVTHILRFIDHHSISWRTNQTFPYKNWRDALRAFERDHDAPQDAARNQ